MTIPDPQEDRPTRRLRWGPVVALAALTVLLAAGLAAVTRKVSEEDAWGPLKGSNWAVVHDADEVSFIAWLRHVRAGGLSPSSVHAHSGTNGPRFCAVAE